MISPELTQSLIGQGGTIVVLAIVGKVGFSYLKQRIGKADIPIVACVVGMVFFMKYDQKQKDSTGHKAIGICLGIGFLALVAFRIIGSIL